MKKQFVALLLLVTMLLSVVGCAGGNNEVQPDSEPAGSATEQNDSKNEAFKDAEQKLLDALAPLPTPGKEYKVAALEITLANPFWVTVKEGYESAAKEYGVQVDVMSAPKEDDVNSQLEALRTVLTKDYDAVAVSPITPFNVIPGIAEANQKNIPVVAVGTNMDEKAAKEAGAKVEAFITCNFKDQGKLGAKYIADKIEFGKVAIIEGLPGAAQSEARKNGAKEGFESREGIEIVSVQAGNWDRKTAYDITLDILQANPDLKGVMCANDVMALGVVEALKSAGKKDQVVVVGIDFIEEAKDSIKNGELDGSVAMSPYLFGKGGLILALKVLEGHEINDDIYWTPLGLVTADNVDTFNGWK